MSNLFMDLLESAEAIQQYVAAIAESEPSDADA